MDMKFSTLKRVFYCNSRGAIAKKYSPKEAKLFRQKVPSNSVVIVFTYLQYLQHFHRYYIIHMDEKGDLTLECSSANWAYAWRNNSFTVEKTRLYPSNIAVFVKFDERAIKRIRVKWH